MQLYSSAPLFSSSFVFKCCYFKCDCVFFQCLWSATSLSLLNFYSSPFLILFLLRSKHVHVPSHPCSDWPPVSPFLRMPQAPGGKDKEGEADEQKHHPLSTLIHWVPGLPAALSPDGGPLSEGSADFQNGPCLLCSLCPAEA